MLLRNMVLHLYYIRIIFHEINDNANDNANENENDNANDNLKLFNILNSTFNF